LNTFRRLGPWLTTGGDIFSFQALGHFDQGGPTTRLEATIDATQNPPRVIFQRDLDTSRPRLPSCRVDRTVELSTGTRHQG
jgi:hypothetical protein